MNVFLPPIMTRRKISCAHIWKWDGTFFTLLPMSFIKCSSKGATAIQASLNCFLFCFSTFIILCAFLCSALISWEFSLKTDLKSRSYVSVMNGDRFPIASPISGRGDACWTRMPSEKQTSRETALGGAGKGTGFWAGFVPACLRFGSSGLQASAHLQGQEGTGGPLGLLPSRINAKCAVQWLCLIILHCIFESC